MAESTIRKTKVSFTVIARGTFVVEHEGDEDPAEVFKRLVDESRLSLPDLYLHSQEFDWCLDGVLDLTYPFELTKKDDA